MNPRNLVLAAVLIAVAWFGYQKLFPDEEGAIRALFSELAADLTIRPGAAPVQRALGGRRVGRYFDDSVTAEIRPPGRQITVIRSRTEIEQAAAQVRARIEEVEVEFLDLTVRILPSGDQAEVRTTGKAEFPEQSDLWVVEMEVELVKREGEWRIFQLRAVETLDGE